MKITRILSVLLFIGLFGFGASAAHAQSFDTDNEQPGLSTRQVANVFTPNGDGLNDAFHPNPGAISSFHMTIYNRWGKQVYATTSGEPWDGRTNSGTAPEGVYVYHMAATYRTGETVDRAGTLTLLR